MMTTYQALQISIVVVMVASTVLTVRFMRANPDRWAYAVPPLTWIAHVLIFYGIVFFRDVLGWFFQIDFVVWSAVIRLQAGFLIAGFMAMLAYERIIFKS